MKACDKAISINIVRGHFRAPQRSGALEKTWRPKMEVKLEAIFSTSEHRHYGYQMKACHFGMLFRSWALNKYTEAVSGLYLTSFWLLFVHPSYIMVTFNLSITYSYYNTLIYSKTYQYLCLIWSHNWNCQFCFQLASQNDLWRPNGSRYSKITKRP